MIPLPGVNVIDFSCRHEKFFGVARCPDFKATASWSVTVGDIVLPISSSHYCFQQWPLAYLLPCENYYYAVVLVHPAYPEWTEPLKLSEGSTRVWSPDS